MFTEIHYILRSRLDGQYVTARLKNPDNNTEVNYILLFKEDYDALSYVNTNAHDVASSFAVESVTGTQLKNQLQRWGFAGVGLVQEPLEPKIQFFKI